MHFEGYQVSNQCMALVRDGCLLPCRDAPELGYAKESSSEQYAPDVFYKVEPPGEARPCSGRHRCQPDAHTRRQHLPWASSPTVPAGRETQCALPGCAHFLSQQLALSLTPWSALPPRTMAAAQRVGCGWVRVMWWACLSSGQ